MPQLPVVAQPEGVVPRPNESDKRDERKKHAERPRRLVPALGTLVRQRREAAGLSRAKVAKRARFSEATLKLIESGHRPSRSTLLRLINVPELALRWDDVAPLYGETAPTARHPPLHVVVVPLHGETVPLPLAECLAALGMEPVGSVQSAVVHAYCFRAAPARAEAPCGCGSVPPNRLW